jgi:hypothetical protein
VIKSSKGFAHLFLIIGVLLVGIVAVVVWSINEESKKSPFSKYFSYIFPQTLEESTLSPKTESTPSSTAPDDCQPGFIEICEGGDCECVQDATSNQVPDGNLVNWKTYRNEEYGFMFKYPFDLDVESGKPFTSFTRPFIGDSERYDENFSMNLWVEEKITKESLDAFFVDRFCNTIKPSAYTKNLQEAIDNCIDLFQETLEKLTIDGHSAIRARNIDYVVERLIIIIEDQPSVVMLSLGESGEEGSGISKKVIETFNQILETFKFTE